MNSSRSFYVRRGLNIGKKNIWNRHSYCNIYQIENIINTYNLGILYINFGSIENRLAIDQPIRKNVDLILVISKWLSYYHKLIFWQI